MNRSIATLSLIFHSRLPPLRHYNYLDISWAHHLIIDIYIYKSLVMTSLIMKINCLKVFTVVSNMMENSHILAKKEI